MRAVFISPIIPSNTGIGLAMRAGLWLEALSRRFDTDLVLAQVFSPPAGGEEFMAEHAASVTNLRGSRGVDKEKPGTVPIVDAESQERLTSLIAHADVVVVFRLYLLELAEFAHIAGIPVIADLDDLDWVREERLGDVAEAGRYLRYAETYLHLADVATTAGVHDAREGPRINPHPTWIQVPNGVRHPSEMATQPQDIDVLFVATLGYAPNAEAAVWFAHEVIPRLPDVRAAFVGAAPTASVRSLASRRVVIAADVPEVSSWYARSRVCIVPIHAGSGTRTKIPEAWAHRRPVVSTSLGAEGLDTEGAALVADSPADFARACEQLLNDEALRVELVEEGWARYVAQHSVDVAMRASDAAIEAALTTGGRAASVARVQL